MIVSLESGFRSIPFYAIPVSLVLKRYREAGRAWNFSEAPAFELVYESAITTIQRITVAGSATALTPTITTIDQLGITYNIYTLAAQQPAYGSYYYSYTVGGVIYYSDVFNILDCTFNFEIKYSNTCSTVLTGNDTHLNKMEFQNLEFVPIGVEGFTNEIENGANDTIVVSSTSRAIWQIDILGDRSILERLRYVKNFDTVIFTIYGEDYTVRRNSIKVDADPINKEFRITLEFTQETLDTVEDCSCDGFGTLEVVGTVDDVECAGLTIAITQTGPQVLHGALTGTPAGDYTLKWYKNGVYMTELSLTGDIKVLSEAAYYELRLKAVGCIEKVTAYQYTNACDGFKVIETAIEGVISANYTGIPDGETVTVSILNSANTGVSTSLPYTASVSGVHSIVATAGSCITTKTFYVNVSSLNSCTHEVDISVSGDILTAVMSNVVGTPVITYKWERQDITGVLTQVSLDDNFTPIVTGIYFVTAIIDGCSSVSSAQLFVIEGAINVVVQNDVWLYEFFSVSKGNVNPALTYIDITAFQLPDVSLLADEEIRAAVRVEYNTAVMYYEDPVANVVQFSIDNANNRITFFDVTGADAIINVWKR
jgi:hypothetical protein